MTPKVCPWRVGETFELQTLPVTTVQLVRYAGASDDYNRIHYEEAFAVSAGLGGVIAHGMLTMAFMGRAVTDWIGAGGEMKRLSARFTAPVRPGDVVRVVARLTEVEDAEGGWIIRADLTAYVAEKIVAVGGTRAGVPAR